ncbi:MAG: phosphatase PAP2 family protein [Solirubrobacteraceae bacterium]
MAWVVWLAWIFDAINNLGEVRQRLAEQHGRQVLDLERALRLAPEHALNAWLAGHRLFAETVVVWYENVHGGVTFGLIAWIWWRRPDLLPPLRAALIAVNLAGLAVFWTWPVAPPRMLADPRFLDLVALVHGQSPYWAPGAVSLDANQLSALPSLHIAWAVWSAIALWRLTERPWVRALAAIYPLLTAAVVMATANHYLADAVTGGLIAGGAVAAADRVWRAPWRPSLARLRPAIGAGSERPH